MKKLGLKLLELLDMLVIPAGPANKVLQGVILFIVLSIVLAKLPALVLVTIIAVARELLGRLRRRKPSLLNAGYMTGGALITFLLMLLG